VYLSIRSSGSSLQTTVDEIRSGLCEITLPEGYGFIIDRKLAELQDRFRTVTLLFLLSLLLIYMVLAAQFESLVLPLAVLSFLPLPLSLPFLALRVAGAPLTVNVLVGIIILSGIAVNNGILIVADMHNRAASFSAVCRHSVLSYTPKACHETSIIRAVRRRLPPMLLTSGSTLLGSLPLLFLAGRTGSPCDSPAFILVWGMAGSLPATFFFYPALLSLFFSAGKVRSRGGMERLR
jgi:HAE1 family hydrophobic/amphiphilic exporter-1